MQAAIFRQTGEPTDVIEIQSFRQNLKTTGPDITPVQTSTIPEKGMVRIQMEAAPVNPSDLMTIRGRYTKQPELPSRIGYEGAGIVCAANAGLYGRWLTGKRVAVLAADGGTWGDELELSAKNVIPVGSRLNALEAASFFVNPATAWLLTRRVMTIPRGDWLVQSAAASAVGQMVCALGKHYGFHTMNVVRSTAAAEIVQQAGGDAVIVTDESDRWMEQLQEQLPGGRIRYAIDPVGGSLGARLVSMLGESGQIVLYGTLSNEPMSFSPRSLMTYGASVRGFWLGAEMAKMNLWRKLSLVSTIRSLQERKILRTVIGEKFRLEDIHKAVVAAETPNKAGKVFLCFGE